MTDRKRFELNKITVAVLLTLGMPATLQMAHAGAGWGDNFDITGAPIKVPTYYANSPSGLRPDPLGGTVVDPVSGNATPLLIDTGTALRKFVDALPGLGETKANLLGQYIPVGSPEKWVNGNGITTTDDYYEIAVVEYSEKMHSDLVKPTRLRGYVQLSTPANPGKHLALNYPDGTPILDRDGVQVYAYDKPHYLGPTIIAQRGTAVRIKFTNYLPTGTAGNLFIPVDKTLPGAGLGPDGINRYTENRAAVHWHGGDTPWISDGTPHQWVAPAGETAAYSNVLDANGTTMGKGVSSRNVPDMPDPGPGSSTFYFPNNLSARLMFYHDHSFGLTRLNVYAGMAAGYLIQDPAEQALVSSGAIPAEQIPLIIQDKTFVPKDIAQQDAKWDTTHWGQEGDLWFPHVYETNQDPNSIDGTNPVGRWDWGPWFWPVFPAQFSLPSGDYGDVSTTPEAFMDTPVINGTAYPTLTVSPKAYRFRVLNASNDRFINLGLYKADPTITPFDPWTGQAHPGFGKEVKMVPAIPNGTFPPTWPTDGRAGGVPDPATKGPDIIQIGSEGGILPKPVVIPSQPITYEANRRSITVLNVLDHGLYMGAAERADIIVDFSAYAGQTLILYNDAPAPVPAFDPRIDYFTGAGDQTSAGGAHDTLPGYGPNTRTMMQIKVLPVPAGGTPTPAFNVSGLNTALPAAYGQSQDRPVVPQSVYNAAFGTNDNDNYGKIATGSLTQPMFNWTPTVAGQTVTGITVTGGGTGYSSAPTVVFNGGVDLSVPGNAKATAVATVDPVTKKITAITLTNPGSGYSSAPLITFVGGGGMGATASVTTSATMSLPVQNKAIQELFEPIYGRMNATLGVELPFTSAVTQTTIPLGYVDPTTETIAENEIQIWKITHNGVDTHPVHFHLVNVQLINRVGWDGTIKPPADGELGWKETVKMNPLEDVLVAVRAKRPDVPFGLPQSSRPMDPSQPLGSTLGFMQLDPMTNNPKVVANAIANYDNEYVWHCHILGHEENDFMRPFVFKPNDIVPDAPLNLNADEAGNLTWIDPTAAGQAGTLGNAKNEIGFTIQRAIGGGVFVDIGTALANATKWSDTSFAPGLGYSYQVIGYNAAGNGQPSNIAYVTGVPNAPSALAASSVTGTQVALTWADNSGSETGFNVIRNGVVIATLAANATSYIDTTVLESTPYSYTVNAFNAIGTSTDSNTLSVTTPLSLPLAPTGAMATASAPGILPVTIAVSWADVATNEASYTVQRKLSTTGSCTTAGAWSAAGSLPANSTTFVDGNVISGSAYCYRVQAVNATGASAWSSTPVPVAPALIVAAPSALTATANTAGTSVALRWTDLANNETTYLVEKSTDGTTFTPVIALTRTAAQRTGVNGAVTYNAVVTPGSLYTFRVTAQNISAGLTTSSAGVTVTADLRAPAAPTAPSGLTATVTSATRAALSWVDNATTETGYVVEVAINGGAFAPLTTIARSAAQRTATGLVSYNPVVQAGRSYAFRVKAITVAYGLTTASAFSNEAATTTIAPSAPTGVAAAQGAVGSIVVSWTDTSSNESGFTVQRSRVTNGIPGAWGTAGTVPAGVTTFTDSGLTSLRRTYRYQVRANSVVGNSAYAGPSADVIVP